LEPDPYSPYGVLLCGISAPVVALQANLMHPAIAQEEVNGILHHNDNNRLVCEHVAPVGSHLPVTTCRTYGEILGQRRADQKFLQDRAMYNH